jgi:hypothetical protein
MPPGSTCFWCDVGRCRRDLNGARMLGKPVQYGLDPAHTLPSRQCKSDLLEYSTVIAAPWRCICTVVRISWGTTASTLEKFAVSVPIPKFAAFLCANSGIGTPAAFIGWGAALVDRLIFLANKTSEAHPVLPLACIAWRPRDLFCRSGRRWLWTRLLGHRMDF